MWNCMVRGKLGAVCGILLPLGGRSLGTLEPILRAGRSAPCAAVAFGAGAETRLRADEGPGSAVVRSLPRQCGRDLSRAAATGRRGYGDLGTKRRQAHLSAD